jgi:hypothetical protein
MNRTQRFQTLLMLERELKKILEDKNKYTDNSIRALKQRIKLYEKLCYFKIL